MSHWVYGVDISFHQLSVQQAKLLKLGGVKVITQCLWTATEQPAHRVTNLRNAMEAGFIDPGYAIAGYASIDRRAEKGAWHMDQARAGVPDDIWDVLRRVSVDVELQGIRVADIRAAVDRMNALGKPRDIYTSWNAWTNRLDVSNPQQFSDCGLWNARWDDNPDFDFPTLRYGPWSDADVWGEQWSSGTNVHGVYADRDQFRADAFGLETPTNPTPVPTPPPGPTPGQLLAAEAVWGEIVMEFAQGNVQLTDELRDKAKFLLGI